MGLNVHSKVDANRILLLADDHEELVHGSYVIVDALVHNGCNKDKPSGCSGLCKLQHEIRDVPF